MRDTKHLEKHADKLAEKAKEKALFRNQRKAVEAGASIVEIGNFDSFYSKGRFFSALEVLSLTVQTRQLLPSVPLSRVGSPKEVADTVMWLLSSKSSYVCGTIIKISGGR